MYVYFRYTDITYKYEKYSAHFVRSGTKQFFLGGTKTIKTATFCQNFQI